MTIEVSPPEITIEALTVTTTEVSVVAPLISVARKVTVYVPTARLVSLFTMPELVSTLIPPGGEMSDHVLVPVPVPAFTVNAAEVL